MVPYSGSIVATVLSNSIVKYSRGFNCSDPGSIIVEGMNLVHTSPGKRLSSAGPVFCNCILDNCETSASTSLERLDLFEVTPELNNFPKICSLEVIGNGKLNPSPLYTLIVKIPGAEVDCGGGSDRHIWRRKVIRTARVCKSILWITTGLANG